MSLPKLLLLLVATFIGLTSATPFSCNDPKDFIVGGFETSIEKIPWQVSLQVNKRDEIISSCGGSIIGDRWVLTAAHCTEFNIVSNVSVRVGSTFKKTGGSIIKLKKIVEHMNYNNVTIEYDFSLLELAEPLKFTNEIQSISLPNADIHIQDGSRALVSGWGDTYPWRTNKMDSDFKLRAACVPVVNQDKCIGDYHGRVITDRMVCAGYEEGGIDSCGGDSGGPLSIENDGVHILVGVVSFGRGCARPDKPGVYSRVSSVRSWINDVTGL